LIYPGKIILLGEYTVLLGSSALAIPSTEYFGTWDENKKVNKILLPFIEFLKEQNFPFLSQINGVDDFAYFECNIPIGYGLGSTGSITAAIYDRFKIKEHESISTLNSHRSQMEAFFHGKSSGIDPLVSLINKPILLKGGEINILHSEIPTHQIHLIDSGQARSTKPWVELFKQKMKSTSFSKLVEETWIPIVQKTIDQLKNNDPEFKDSWKALSEFQLAHMSEMIPNHIQEIWEEGLKNNDQYLKLCGAGGGGMFLSLKPPLNSSSN